MALLMPNYFKRENRDWKANLYRIKTSLTGIKRLITLPQEDKDACVDAYKFLQGMQAGEQTETEDVLMCVLEKAV